MRHAIILALAAGVPASGFAQDTAPDGPAMSYGQRPAYLADKLEDGELKDTLEACLGQSPERTDFSVGHRGAPLMFPEHTVQSNRAAARQGAGILECDVTFTKDKELVCRHAQNDLHTTTNILTTDLAEKCTQPFEPASGDTEASAECRTSDLTLEEFRTLEPKMDSSDPTAETAEAYQGGVAPFRTTAFADGADLMTHSESIELFRSLGAKFTPELKAPSVEMPFDGMTQEDYAQKLIDEYKAADVPPEDVWPQSFNLSDVRYWIDNTEYGGQAVYLDDRYEAEDEDEGLIDPTDPETFKPTMQELADMGVNYIAPPIWMLITLDDAGEIVPSAYAQEAKDAGLEIIAWSLERSGPLAEGGGWYFQSVNDTIDSDADYLTVLDVLAQDVGIAGMFSDWPATVTFYANCKGL
ncbi:glycerophosphoryl diester phosphodiesterase [Tranquillimonas rosea]|uniref:glycerophosphodiester phosphodiesterase n=1 Tax=Tranquillimonas rosea TaxID=641238 RepID=A0A1H9WU18_9RHOB|nr:glycerophosphodiester phosphodiesterase family protein [Tranquillimonas rosea]SES37428.1 glycerophosphoryl diester phosphodiesterase [Tranquillimonas rosea]